MSNSSVLPRDAGLPWEQGAPIFPALQSWDGRPPFELPDEPPPEPNRLRFSGGSLEGIMGHWSGE
jgi:hypothetical protein